MNSLKKYTCLHEVLSELNFFGDSNREYMIFHLNTEPDFYNKRKDLCFILSQNGLLLPVLNESDSICIDESNGLKGIPKLELYKTKSGVAFGISKGRFSFNADVSIDICGELITKRPTSHYFVRKYSTEDLN